MEELHSYAYLPKNYTYILSCHDPYGVYMASVNPWVSIGKAVHVAADEKPDGILIETGQIREKGENPPKYSQNCQE